MPSKESKNVGTKVVCEHCSCKLFAFSQERTVEKWHPKALAGGTHRSSSPLVQLGGATTCMKDSMVSFNELMILLLTYVQFHYYAIIISVYIL